MRPIPNLFRTLDNRHEIELYYTEYLDQLLLANRPKRVIEVCRCIRRFAKNEGRIACLQQLLPKRGWSCVSNPQRAPIVPLFQKRTPEIWPQSRATLNSGEFRLTLWNKAPHAELLALLNVFDTTMRGPISARFCETRTIVPAMKSLWVSTSCARLTTE